MVDKEMLIELVEDTIMEYSPDPENTRSVDTHGDCVYLGPGGRMCAVGRLLSDKDLATLVGRGCNTGYTAVDLIGTCNPPSLRGIPVGFLTDLQHLHDGSHNWDYEEGGLSEKGWSYVTWMLENIEASRYESG